MRGNQLISCIRWPPITSGSPITAGTKLQGVKYFTGYTFLRRQNGFRASSQKTFWHSFSATHFFHYFPSQANFRREYYCCLGVHHQLYKWMSMWRENIVSPFAHWISLSDIVNCTVCFIMYYITSIWIIYLSIYLYALVTIHADRVVSLGRILDSVCLFVCLSLCLFVRSITQNRMIPKCSNLI